MTKQEECRAEVMGLNEELVALMNEYTVNGDFAPYGEDKKRNQSARFLIAKRAIALLSLQFAVPVDKVTVQFKNEGGL